MSGLILVVDDNEKNLKLLEALLSNEYYDVVTAVDGFDGIAKAKERLPDMILLDVMMPGIDGFETCKRLKADPVTSHIPIVMVTALSDKSDRVHGLESGADDFLTKPVKEVQLISRVKSLIRLKMLIDELRLRDKTGLQLGIENGDSTSDEGVYGSRILVVDDDYVQCRQIQQNLNKLYKVDILEEPEHTLKMAADAEYDLIIMSNQLSDMDGLRICSQIRSNELLRNTPILTLIDADDEKSLLKGLEIGVNDYVMTPPDYNELNARVRTQIRRKRFQDALKNNYKRSISMAITDSLTGLYNRHYLNTHMESLMDDARKTGNPLSVIILDMDHFKQVNDTYGHDCGDQVLKQLSERITNNIRGSDLAARIGGEEFVVLMPKTETSIAQMVAERLRKSVESTPFEITHRVGQISKTTSIGLTTFAPSDNAATFMKRSDEALYSAKNGGRNKVVLLEITTTETTEAPPAAAEIPMLPIKKEAYTGF